MPGGAAGRADPAGAAPSAWIMRWCARLAQGATVLDLACGSGRHARALAAQGCRVDAVDVDPACGRHVADLPAVCFRALDLEQGPWPFADGQYDAIVVSRYLHRPRLTQLADALRDGGVLVYETFAAGQPRYGRPHNPEFLLEPFELAACFAPLLHVLAFEDGVIQHPAAARVQRLCAVRTSPERLERLALSD